jgi:D-xylose transport system substrate-binding protein
MDSMFFIQEAQKLGFEAIVTNGQNNENLQFKQAQELIEKGVKVMCIAAVNSNTAGTMVRMAQEEGVKTISYDGVLNNCPVDYCITFDNFKLGGLMAQYAVSKAPQGDYIILGGDKANLNAVEIRMGQGKVLEPFLSQGKIKIVYDGYTEVWSRDEAYITMKKYLKLSSGAMPAAILGANDEIALGAIQAIKEYFAGTDYTLPISTGQDASLVGCRSIINNEQSMTVYKPIRKLAAMAVDVSSRIIKGQTIDQVNTSTNNGAYDIPTIMLDLITVDKQNMESTVIADGFQKKGDLYK